jgi:hypothetical protein
VEHEAFLQEAGVGTGGDIFTRKQTGTQVTKKTTGNKVLKRVAFEVGGGRWRGAPKGVKEGGSPL